MTFELTGQASFVENLSKTKKIGEHGIIAAPGSGGPRLEFRRRLSRSFLNQTFREASQRRPISNELFGRHQRLIATTHIDGWKSSLWKKKDGDDKNGFNKAKAKQKMIYITC